MTYELLVSPLAEAQIAEACQFYASQNHITLVDDFLNDFYESCQPLRINPRFQIRRFDYRTLPFRKFPYLIFFKILEEEKIVKINSIFNTNQDPQKYPIYK